MPWTGQQFAERHNHGLSGMKAEHASRIANAVLRSGMPEGESIAIANKWAQHHDGGGMVDPTGSVSINQPSLGGMTPSATVESPMYQQMIQRYQQMTPEHLQEKAMMAGNSPQGQIIKRVLQQKLMMPQVVAQPQPESVMGMGAAAGGSIAHRAPGGGLGMNLSQADPWWTRSEARSADAAPMTGYLHGATSGRADALHGTALTDSYILPAAELAGLGEGNPMFGARVIRSMLGTGPHGIPMPSGSHGRGPPHPPSIQEPEALRAAGGNLQQDNPTTDVALSHAEYAMTPEEVMAFTGRKTLASAQRTMDLLVMELRKRNIKELKELKPPVGMKKQ